MRDDKGRFVAGHRKIGGMPKGGHQTEEAKSKVSASLVGKTAEQARRWKGEEASYHANRKGVPIQRLSMLGEQLSTSLVVMNGRT